MAQAPQDGPGLPNMASPMAPRGPNNAQRWLEVVAAEGDAVRDADRPVGDHGKVPVVRRLLEEEVVRELVDRQEERLRDRRAEHVRDGQGGGPRELGGGPREPDLRDDEQEQADVLGAPLGPAELRDLRVRAQRELPRFPDT